MMDDEASTEDSSESGLQPIPAAELVSWALLSIPVHGGVSPLMKCLSVRQPWERARDLGADLPAFGSPQFDDEAGSMEL